MKRILSTNAFQLMMSAFLAFTFTSCQKTPVQTTIGTSGSPGFTNARTTSSASLQSVSLKVTVNDATGYKITSDGNVVYNNGLQNVSAFINKYGNFVFYSNTSGSPKPAIRRLNFTVNDPSEAPIPTKTSNNYYLETGASITLSEPFIPLQNLGVGSSELLSMRAWGLTGNIIDWRLLLHMGYDDVSSSSTDYVRVARTSTDEWTITPSGSSQPYLNVAALRSSDANTLYGYYRMPFFLTLTRQ